MLKEFSLGCIVVLGCCHSLSFVAIRYTTYCHSLYHSLPFAVTCCHSKYHSSVFLERIKQGQPSSFHFCWKWTGNILIHSLTSYKCKYIMITEATIGSCSENDFPEKQNSLKVSVKEFFHQSFKPAVFEDFPYKYFKRNIEFLIKLFLCFNT